MYTLPIHNGRCSPWQVVDIHARLAHDLALAVLLEVLLVLLRDVHTDE